MTSSSGQDNDETIRVRQLEPAHVAEVMRIAVETRLSHWSAQSYLDEMKNPDAVMLRLADDDYPVAGFIVGRFIAGGTVEVRKDAEIYNIAITSDKQRCGLGQRLLDAFLERCRESEARQVWLEVRESNNKAIDFYRKNGFEYVQTRPNFYDEPREHALLMRLDLKDREG